MAVGDPHVFPGFLTPVLTRVSFQSHRLFFSHASAEMRGEDRTHNHQVISLTRLKYISAPQENLLRPLNCKTKMKKRICRGFNEKNSHQ